jgi:DNA-binding transcriptional LysR family regulator
LPKGHRLARRKLIEAKDLQGEAFVALSRTDRARRRIDAILDGSGVKPRVVVETHYALSVCQFVQAGTGIGLINPYSLSCMAPDSIEVRRFAPKVQFRTLMIFPPQRPRSDLTIGFAQIAHEIAKRLLKETLGRFGLI